MTPAPTPSPAAQTPRPLPYRPRAVLAWLALLLGTFGVHRWVVRGPRDALGALQLALALTGLAGVWRMRQFGQDDRLSWLLVPLLGLAVSAAMLNAIVWALMSDQRWDDRYNPAHPPSETGRGAGWAAVWAAVIGLMVGGVALLGTIAFAGQRFFEWQLADSAAASAGTGAGDGDAAPALRPSAQNSQRLSP